MRFSPSQWVVFVIVPWWAAVYVLLIPFVLMQKPERVSRQRKSLHAGAEDAADAVLAALRAHDSDVFHAAAASAHLLHMCKDAHAAAHAQLLHTHARTPL